MDFISLAEARFVPDPVVRFGIRRLLAKRLRSVQARTAAEQDQCLRDVTQQLRAGPLAVATQTANQQHYEVPAEFFVDVLGPQLKYSACYFATPRTSLADAEEEMLQQTCRRAEITDGMRVLELGCGWGSFTLWIAKQFPHSEVTAVSNSTSQRHFIESRARAYDLTNLRVITADMREFSTEKTFDRIVSIEMFEHMRNYELLLHRVSNWLAPQGKAFVHIFCHRQSPYFFQTEGADNWMGRHFFTGGIMPSADLLGQFDDDLIIEQQWRVSGLHYWRTCEAWLKNLDSNRAAIFGRFRKELSARAARKQLQRWRMFLMACAELFRYRGGDEWFVAHYRLRNKTPVVCSSRTALAHESS